MRIPAPTAILLTSVIFLGGCTKKSDVSPAPSGVGGTGWFGALTASTALFVQMTIDGATVSYTEGTSYGFITDNSGETATPPAPSVMTTIS